MSARCHTVDPSRIRLLLTDGLPRVRKGWKSSVTWRHAKLVRH